MSDSPISHDAPPPAKETPARVGSWALLFALLMLLFAALTILALVYPRPRSLQQSEAARRRGLLGNQKERQLEQLHSYGWVDEKRHLAHIPIDVAMKESLAPKPTLPAQP